MRASRARTPLLLAVVATLFAGLAALVAPAASATTAPSTAQATVSQLRGTTSVTTAPGIAGTLIKAGVLPLPVPPTSFRFGYDDGINATYGFGITGGNPDLEKGTGHILHSGGIDFVDLKGNSLEIGRFDIDLAKATVFTREVNFERARIPALDVDLSNLQVRTHGGTTVLTGIDLYLAPAAADAVNATFGLHLPDDGSLLFASARIVLRS